MGKPLPIRVPSMWFSTTSTVSSSTTLRPYCRPLPILGFTAFPSVAKRNFPRCACRPSKPSLRRQRRVTKRVRFPWARVTASAVSSLRVHREPCPLALSPRPNRHVGCPPHQPVRSRGLEALLHRRVRCARGRCQPPAPGAPLGLSSLSAPASVASFNPCMQELNRAPTTITNKPALRQRPLREAGSSV